MSDLIRRQDAIEAIRNYYPVRGRSSAMACLTQCKSVSVDKEYLIDLIQEAVYDGEACAKLMDLVDRPTEWIPFTKRPLTDEEKEEYPDWIYIFDCPLPDDGQEIILSNGKYVWTDTFFNDDGCYLDGGDDIDEGMAWMPLPDPWNGGEEE